jgi:preprotein translocase subunit YajC
VFFAQNDSANGGGDSVLFPLLMIVALFAIFYFLIVRPNRRRRQTMERLQRQLAIGDEVMTSSGLYATVAELDEKTVILETSEGVYARYARGAVLEVVTRSGAETGGEAEAESSVEDEPAAVAETADEPEKSDTKS